MKKSLILIIGILLITGFGCTSNTKIIQGKKLPLTLTYKHYWNDISGEAHYLTIKNNGNDTVNCSAAGENMTLKKDGSFDLWYNDDSMNASPEFFHNKVTINCGEKSEEFVLQK